uniref:Uncharacterized protein n=1 Tax=Anguilla anguilla TaxID=7936 RepID=A0A0E9PFU1_ANGAN
MYVLKLAIPVPRLIIR